MIDLISRRTALRGLGVSMALPMLDAMLPARASAATALAAGAAPAAAPVRIAFVFMPNGVNYDAWAPITEGAAGAFKLSQTLEPLTPVRSHLNIFTGLTLKKARANGDGPGDHARSSASFLTGSQARKTAGNDIRNGVSVDQLAASKIGANTRLPSVELGCEHGPSAGNCDSGYSCAYSSNISWRDDHTPVPKVVDPAVAFERLFGDATQAAAAKERLSRRQSILDFVLEDSRSLAKKLGASDQQKLDQFQTAVREIEQRIERARKETAPRKIPTTAAPAGIPDKLSEHMDLMYDMLLLAFQTDTTRVGTLMLANDGSNRTFAEIGIKEGHHHLSHHENNKEMVEKIRKIDRFHVERFAKFVQKLSQTKESDGSGTLLDNSLILLGGGISDGNKHNHEDLPIIVVGRGGGIGTNAVKTGRLIKSPRETPLCNLYLAMLERAGAPQQSFADSTGALAL
jgi:hypothetical protein